jgi:hypothetical protein
MTPIRKFAASFSYVLGLALAATPDFHVPEDIALRIRLDDTLTSTDSQVRDPFSATVVDAGKYRKARVYGHVADIDLSGSVKGNTSMVLRFDELVMRRAKCSNSCRNC